MSKKVTSAMAAYIRSKAERRGRNVEMAEKAVVESKSFTEKEALELKLIDLVANDVPDLLAQLEGREVKRFDGSDGDAPPGRPAHRRGADGLAPGDPVARSRGPRSCSCCCSARSPASEPRSATPA